MGLGRRAPGAAFLCLQGVVLALVCRHVTEEYMDEPFHGPQTRKYCSGSFQEWDPKITTFPGLYILGALYGLGNWLMQKAIGQEMDMEEACSTVFLRSLNVLLSLACFGVLRDVFLLKNSKRLSVNCSTARPAERKVPAPTGLHPNEVRCTAAVMATQQALTLSLYPLHWFYSFLYYTDVGSTLFLLLCYRMCLLNSFLLAGAAGVVAVLFRQTNAVWVAFLLGGSALRLIAMDEASSSTQALGMSESSTSGASMAVQQRQQQQQQQLRTSGRATVAGSAHASSHQNDDGQAMRTSDMGVVSTVALPLCLLWRQRQHLVQHLWPLALAPAAFVVFLVHNGGVTVGDREAHAPVKHLAQLLYFAAWAAAVLAPCYASLPILAALWRGLVRVRLSLAAVLVVVMGTAVAMVMVWKGTVAHPYLLADNRHYTFYVWRKVIARHPMVRYLLVPVYVAAWAVLLAGLLRRQSVLWVLGFLACLAVTLVPAGLLELRYFTPGFLLLALHLPQPGPAQLRAGQAVYMAINAFTIYMFVFRPFTWPDGTTARFMW